MFLVARVFVTQTRKHVGSGYAAVHVPGNLLIDTEMSDFTYLWCLGEVVLELVPERKHTLEYKYMSEQNGSIHESSLSFSHVTRFTSCSSCHPTVRPSISYCYMSRRYCG